MIYRESHNLGVHHITPFLQVSSRGAASRAVAILESVGPEWQPPSVYTEAVYNWLPKNDGPGDTGFATNLLTSIRLAATDRNETSPEFSALIATLRNSDMALSAGDVLKHIGGRNNGGKFSMVAWHSLFADDSGAYQDRTQVRDLAGRALSDYHHGTGGSLARDLSPQGFARTHHHIELLVAMRAAQETVDAGEAFPAYPSNSGDPSTPPAFAGRA